MDRWNEAKNEWDGGWEPSLLTPLSLSRTTNMADSIQELAAKLAEHEEQLYKVNKLLQLTPQDPDLLKMKQDLEQLVALTKTLQANAGIPAVPSAAAAAVPASEPQANNEASSSTPAGGPGSKFRPQDRVVAMWEDGEWYIARVEKVNAPAEVGRVSTYDVLYLEYGNSWTVSDDQIRPYVPAPQDALLPGRNVRAINPEDGMMYPARIAGTGSGLGRYVVEYKAQKLKPAEVLAYDILLDPKADEYERRKEEEKAKLLAADTFVVPEHLKPRDTDTSQQRQIKRQKLRRLKSEWKKRKLHDEGEKKKASWLSFQSSLERRRGKRLKRSIFATTDDDKKSATPSASSSSQKRQKQYVAADSSIPLPPSFQE